MDLLSTIRKEGSRGGVDFKWSDVSTSQHRENYLGHSLMAPVGRWQKNKDLSWYAKADSESTLKDKDGNPIEETAEERRARERREEIKRIKEAEEDALARALGLPVVERGGNGMGSGANAIDVGEVGRAVRETVVEESGEREVRRRGFGEFVGKSQGTEFEMVERDLELENGPGGLAGLKPRNDVIGVKRGERSGKGEAKDREDRRDERRERSRERRHRHDRRERSRDRERGGERHRRREGHHGERERRRSRSRSRSPDRRERRYRSRSRDGHRDRNGREERKERRSRSRDKRKDDRDDGRERRRDYDDRDRDHKHRSRRDSSKDRRGEREREREREHRGDHRR